MPLFSRARLTRFEVHASYRSAVSPACRYDVHAAGAYPKGADMADAYRGRVVMATGDAHRQLTVDTERFTPRLERIDWPAHPAPEAGRVIDPAFLAQFIMVVDPSADEERAHKEARDLFAVLKAAGMGPKVGLPDTKELLLVSASSDYR